MTKQTLINFLIWINSEMVTKQTFKSKSNQNPNLESAIKQIQNQVTLSNAFVFYQSALFIKFLKRFSVHFNWQIISKYSKLWLPKSFTDVLKCPLNHGKLARLQMKVSR